MIAENVNIGAKVRAVIAEKGISQIELGRMLNKSVTYVTRLLKKETIDTSSLNILCSKLGYNFFVDFGMEAGDRGRFLLAYPHAGNLISSRLKKEKVTQGELGKFLGVSHQEISRLLKGKSIDTGRLLKISKFLDCNLFSCFYYAVGMPDEGQIIRRFTEFLTTSEKETGFCSDYLRSVIRDYLNEIEP